MLVFSGCQHTNSFWRIGNDESGNYRLVNPEGNKKFVVLINNVNPYQYGISEPHYIDSDYKKDKTWAEIQQSIIRGFGFDGVDAWGHPSLYDSNLPICKDLNLWISVNPKYDKVFYPQWKDEIESAVDQQVPRLKDKTSLIGYYLDNEIDWSDKNIGPKHYFDNLSNSDPNRQEVIKSIKELGGWSENIEHYLTLPVSEKYEELCSVWRAKVATRYFQTACNRIRFHDKNHLILGVRFNKIPPREVLLASIPFIDIHSVNIYENDPGQVIAVSKYIYEITGKPVINSEFSFMSMDNRSGNKNRNWRGNGFVKTSQDRAESLNKHLNALKSEKYIVGCSWFSLNDEPPSGRTRDGEDCNFGIVDIHGRPYKELVDVLTNFQRTNK